MVEYLEADPDADGQERRSGHVDGVEPGTFLGKSFAFLDETFHRIVKGIVIGRHDGLFCPGGNAGIVAAYALSLFNKRVPDDISLIASENKLFSCYATPPQTTITQYHIQLAEQTADIIDAFPDSPPKRDCAILPYSLILRDSVRSMNL